MSESIFDKFTNLYSLEKTLRFELKPVFQTEKKIKECGFLESDKKKSEDYKEVKKILDEYHKYFIDEVLQLQNESNELEWKYLEDLSNNYEKLKKNKNNEKNQAEIKIVLEDLQKEQKNLREKISKLFKDAKGYNELTASTPADLFKCFKPKKDIDNQKKDKNNDKNKEKHIKTFSEWFNEVKDKERKEEKIREFSGFGTYFEKYQKSRENIYKADKPIAVSYRIVNDNFPKFLKNIETFVKIKEKCPEVIENAESELKDLLNKEGGISKVFDISSYNRYLTQAGIEIYNIIIGGYADKEDEKKKRGINEFLNEYRQHNPEFLEEKENKKLKMIPLFKQILSDRSSISFKFETISNDDELEKTVKEYADKLEEKMKDGKSVLDICSALFCSIKEMDLNEIYVNRKDINNISRILTGDWSWLQKRMNAYADEVCKTKSEKQRWQKSIEVEQDKSKTKIVYSLEELNSVLECKKFEETEIKITDYLEHRKSFFYDENGIFKQGDKFVAYSIKELCNDILDKHRKLNEVFENNPENTYLRDNQENIEKIKDYLKSVLELFHRIKPFKLGEDISGDPSFYSDFDFIYSFLGSVVPLYNKTRNYITKKAGSPEKYKLNFDNPTLAHGWDVNKEQTNTSVLLRKDGMYYLGIMNPKNKPKFAEKYEVADGQSCYEKMIYKQFDATKQIPKCSTQMKEVQKYFLSGATAPYILNDKKSFKSELIITKEIWFLNNHVWNGEKFVTKRDNDTRHKKFQIGYFKQTGDFDGYKNALSKWISFCKEFLQSYLSTTVYDYNFKKSDEYEGLDDFYNYLNATCYKLTFINIPDLEINKMVSEGKLYLFQIYNKDFASGANGMPNMHTLYWKNLFSEENLKNVCLKLNGETTELFYRQAGIKEPTVHAKGSYLVNRTTEDGESIPEKIYLEIYKNANGKQDLLSDEAKTYKENHKIVIKKANHEIIKDRHYTEAKFLFYVPITINFKANSDVNKININNMVIDSLKNNSSVNIIGLDRGERNLIYLSLINQQGEIIKQFSLNGINGIDYCKKLDVRAIDRDESRKNWKTIAKISDLKEGYISAVVHKIAQLMIENNAIIVMENLNVGFKRGRVHIEKQVYQKFESMLINKLNYLVFKDKNEKEPGGVLNGLQLTNKFKSFEELGNQSGMLFYVPAGYTSKIDPKTGFVNLFEFSKLINVTAKREFFDKFERIYFNQQNESFVFEFRYKNFDGIVKQDESGRLWAAYSKGERIVYNKNEHKCKKISPTEELKKLFNANKIEYSAGSDIKRSIMEIGEELKPGERPPSEVAAFWDNFLRNFKYILQMRNSNNETGEDYIVSPVMDKEGEFFDSREERKKGDSAGLPIDADANGAYHIALKGLLLIKRLNSMQTKDNKVNPISNAEWFKFVQNKEYDRKD